MIGLMSGTSMDGIDLALVETDGKKKVRCKAFKTVAYAPAFRRKLRAALGKAGAPEVEKKLTLLHATAVLNFLKEKKVKASSINALGFHGHTLLHEPKKRRTVQIGDGVLLSRLTGIPVIYDFRSEDVKAGGQGAPLVPLYHAALAATWKKPLVFLNIGGVANVTCMDAKGGLLAFDTGPGNALLDDWMLRQTGKPYDRNGALAAKGKIDEEWVTRFLAHPYFKAKPPKSLDRDTFLKFVPQHLNAADGAATLTAMTAASIALGVHDFMKKPAQRIVVCGGGRKNATLMRGIGVLTGIRTVAVETRKTAGKKLNGDALEAEAFAYLAARVAMGLPVSLPETTGRKA
jgi:anhydro-N-acetylmuramic acid kinase